VTARPGEHVDTDRLRDFARERLAHFKVPKHVEVVDDLPKTGTGKVQKFLLREQAATWTTHPEREGR
jgi:fatty-acyl-CoA synthase